VSLPRHLRGRAWPRRRLPRRLVRVPLQRARASMRARAYRKPWGLRGAESDLGSFGTPDVIYGIVPMAAVVGVGLWMALRG
jgi:hypothetical protein